MELARILIPIQGGVQMAAFSLKWNFVDNK